MNETKIREYIRRNKHKTLRQLKSEIETRFHVSKGLDSIGKVRDNPKTEEDDVEHDPEIIRLKKKLKKR